MINKDLVIIGGGSAGLNAAISAYDNGIRDILIVEQNNRLGGILNQCIHNGFGLHVFQEELTGPAFATKCISMVKERKIAYMLNTTVVRINEKKEVEYISPERSGIIKAKAIILSVGCYERNRGAILTPGYRPEGIYTAGSAQKLLNEDGYLVGKKCFILGSGDIGLIMARRMTLEGAEVLGVAEIMPYSNGLKRNIVQCLNDYNIPLYLSHTVTNIFGKNHLEGIELSQVDDQLKPLKGTSKFITCDTLLLSIGLIPENSLLKAANVLMDERTKGPIVDENLNTSISGIFACGNGLHVHDLVDYVALEARQAGLSASRYLKQQTNSRSNTFKILPKAGLNYVLPQIVHYDASSVTLKTRVKKPFKRAKIVLKSNNKSLKVIPKNNLFPAEMLIYKIDRDVISNIKDTLEVSVIDNE